MHAAVDDRRGAGQRRGVGADPELRGFTSDPHVTPRLIMAMALGVAVHGEWLFGDRLPSQRALVTEMSNFTLFGLPGPERPA